MTLGVSPQISTLHFRTGPLTDLKLTVLSELLTRQLQGSVYLYIHITELQVGVPKFLYGPQ